MRTLYVVASPIGNLNDTTPRMREVLSSCALIAAEDTRVTSKLLSHFDIHTPAISYHRHNEMSRAAEIIARMSDDGIDVALISDAGTPCISDPGHVLVRMALDAGMDVIPVCGPSAVTAALSACGFKTGSFGFFGFLPRDKKACMNKLKEILRTGLDVAVLYESPKRVKDLMRNLADILQDCRICLFCDLSKFYELTLRGRPSEVLQALEANPKSEKGEYTLVIDLCSASAPPAPKTPESSPVALYIDAVMKGMTGKEAVAFISAEYNVPRNIAYQAQLKAKEFLK